MIKNLDAEKTVIGSMLIDTDAVFKAREIVGPGEFYDTRHRHIFSAILDVVDLGETPNLLTVTDQLRAKHGEEFWAKLSEIVADVPTSAQVRYAAEEVRKKAILRRIHRWSQEITEAAEKNGKNPAQWLPEIAKQVVELSGTVRPKKSPHIGDVCIDLKREWEEFRVAKSEGRGGEKAGGRYCEVELLKPFNAESPVPYFMPGHLWMVAGYTSVGKSTALAQLLADGCRAGARALVFSLEESRTTKAAKLLANLTNIPQRYLLTGELSDEQRHEVRQAEDLIRSWKIMIYDDARTLDEICLKTKKHCMQSGVDIVAVDYVQNIVGDGGSIYNDMRTVGPRLLDLAGELGTTVIAVSQVTNESMRNDSEIIGLKGAGELAAAADIVLWLKRSKKDAWWLDCEIRKNRPFGQTGIVPLAFSDRYTRVARRG